MQNKNKRPKLTIASRMAMTTHHLHLVGIQRPRTATAAAKTTAPAEALMQSLLSQRSLDPAVLRQARLQAACVRPVDELDVTASLLFYRQLIQLSGWIHNPILGKTSCHLQVVLIVSQFMGVYSSRTNSMAPTIQIRILLCESAATI